MKNNIIKINLKNKKYNITKFLENNIVEKLDNYGTVF